MSKELIRARFIEAADVERRMPRVSGPRCSSYWPGYDFTAEEREGWTKEDQDEDRARWAARRNITPDESSRYSEVLDWAINHIQSVDMRRLVWTWAFCQVIPGRSFVAACNRNGWKRSTAYARLERLWERLGNELDNVCHFLRPPRGYSDGQKSDPELLSLISCNTGAPSSAAVLNEPYRTEPSRDLIRSEEDADAFASWLEKRNKIVAKRRRKLGLEA